jgi:TonB family protein
MNRPLYFTMAMTIALSGCAAHNPKPAFDPTPRTELATNILTNSRIVADITKMRVVHADLPDAFPGIGPNQREIIGRAVFSFTVDETGTTKDIQLLSATVPGLGDEYQTYIERWKFEPPLKDGAPTRVQKQIRLTLIPAALNERTGAVGTVNGIEYQGRSVASDNLQRQITAGYEVLFKAVTGCQKIDRLERTYLGPYKPIKFNASGIAIAGEMQERWVGRGCSKVFIGYVWYAFTPEGKTNHAVSMSPERVRAIVNPPTIR